MLSISTPPAPPHPTPPTPPAVPPSPPPALPCKAPCKPGCRAAAAELCHAPAGVAAVLCDRPHLCDPPALQGGRAGLGKGAAVLQDVEVFDPHTTTWRAAPPMAAPRTSHAAAALGGRLYAVGGQDSRSTHATCEVFDPAGERWATLGARLQLPRKYLGLTAAAGGYLIGWR